ncbi:hypothetical protein D3C73_1619740 [compost metagenome]
MVRASNEVQNGSMTASNRRTCRGGEALTISAANGKPSNRHNSETIRAIFSVLNVRSRYTR